MSTIFVFIALILLVMTPDRLGYFDANLNIVYAAIYLISVFIFLVNHRRYSKNWLRFDVVFLIGYTIVHLQIPTLASFGIEPVNADFIWFNKRVVNYATWLSVTAIVLWMLGYSSYKIRNSNCKPIICKEPSYYIFDRILVFLLLTFMVTVGPSIYAGVYDGNESWGSGAIYIFLILISLIKLRIIYFFKKYKCDAALTDVVKSLIKNKLFAIVLLIFVLIFLWIGDRGPILEVAFVFAGAYAIFIKPMSFKSLVIYMLIGAFIFSILGLGRSKDASSFANENIIERGYVALNESEDFIFTNELASSNRILYIALDQVPEKYFYLCGLTYVLNVWSVIPLVPGLALDVLDIPRMYRGTSDFFTIITLGDNTTWGVGGEVIADIYINFGVYGVLVLMFIFGRLSSKAFDSALSHKTAYIIIYLCLLAEAISINRGMLLEPLKPIVYMLVLHYCFVALKNKKLG